MLLKSKFQKPANLGKLTIPSFIFKSIILIMSGTAKNENKILLPEIIQHSKTKIT